MRELLHQLFYSTSANVTVTEAFLLLLLAGIAWWGRRKKNWFPVAYSVFLILYITLLRRAPGYDENIRLHLKLLPNAGIWAGHLLNLLLYIPLGWMARRWKPQQIKKIICLSAELSVVCELVQYLTARGWADINDILFNTIGAVVGIWLAGRPWKTE